jgi:tRNA nucleotidyltransferase/poly(A) polymerase
MKLRELLQILQDVQDKIGTSPCKICGGTARDKYIGNLKKISDIDITTGSKDIAYLAEEFYKVLNKNYNIIRKIMDDGHSSLFIGNLKMDFSSNFILPNIDPILNKMGISAPTDMQKELFSRDFTCNSLLMTFDLKNILDPTYQGFKDIKEKKIRTCLAPNITLTSYNNRVIRSVYLAAKLGFDVDNSIIEYVNKNPASVRIAYLKSLNEKLGEAFKWDADKASYLLTKMNLWNYVPISEQIYPYYIKYGKGTK